MTINLYYTNQPPTQIDEAYLDRIGVATNFTPHKFQVGSGSSVFVVTGIGTIGIGSVGIGTTNPLGKLHITSENSGDCRVYIEADADNNSEGDNPFLIFKKDGGLEGASIWLGNLDGSNDNSLNLSCSAAINGGIRFATGTVAGGWENSSERMRITGIGSVGIGSTNPVSQLDVIGNIHDSSGNLRKVPQNAQTSAYVLVASDTGKHISITTGGVTVPSNVFSIGDTIAIYNNSGTSQTITEGGGVTLRLSGTSSTGNRTLAQYGLCTVLCVSTNTFVISGSGLT
jgi:hypothetical protein